MPEIPSLQAGNHIIQPYQCTRNMCVMVFDVLPLVKFSIFVALPLTFKKRVGDRMRRK